MMTKIAVKNFRSLEAVELEPGALTMLYGPTASGKSSLLYALLVAKNMVENPNRPADAFFDLGFANLGGFEACAYNRDTSKPISLCIFYSSEQQDARYELTLEPNKAIIRWEWPGRLSMEIDVAVPYAFNKNVAFRVEEPTEGVYSGEWNGFWAQVRPESPSASPHVAGRLASWINSAPELLRAVDIAPYRRGFFKPSYSPVPTSAIPWTDDELASLLMTGTGDLAARVSVYTERIFQRDFRLFTPPGSSIAFLQTTDKEAVVPTFLVNDGYGVNQVVYMLVKLLWPKNRLVLLEEPEAHLHPKVVRAFVRQLCHIVQSEDKQVILSTHSELVVASALTAVREGKLAAQALRCYLCVKDGKRTIAQVQRVNSEGQIEGGLASFAEAELEDLKSFLGV